jgi:BirA family biotin operon repressor/biotin-[acetyl-CoA-carboxylase] ligase
VNAVDLDAAMLQDAFAATVLAGRVAVHPRLDSTQDECQRRLADGIAPPFVVFAERQDRGRGQHGRRWISPPGAQVCCSLAWAFARRTPIHALSLAVGVLLAEVLERYGVPIALKWPNDLYAGDRKLGGILIEARPEEAQWLTVIGIGINVALPDSAAAVIGRPWTDLARLGLRIDRTCLAIDLLRALIAGLPRFAAGGFASFHDEFQRHDWLSGRIVAWREGTIARHGRVLGVDGAGALHLATPQGVAVWVSARHELELYDESALAVGRCR